MDFLEIIENGSKEEIQKALIDRFKKNYTFFSIYNKDFENLLKTPPKNFSLIVDDNGINIYDEQNRHLIYPQDENGKHTLIEASKNLAYNPPGNSNWVMLKNDFSLGFLPEELDETKDIYNSIMSSSTENNEMFTNIYNLPLGMLPTLNMFGLASGLHLEYMRRDNEYIHSLMIYEDNVDFFTISAHFVDYEELFATVNPESTYLFIDSITDTSLIERFFLDRRVTSNFIRMELTLYETPKIMDAKRIVKEFHKANARGWGTFEDEMKGITNTYTNIKYDKDKLDYKVLNNRAKIENVPICVIGAGPSLEDSIKFIKRNKKNMIIMSAGTSVGYLVKNGIYPDIHVEIERHEYLNDILQDLSLPKKTILMAASVVNNRALKVFEKENILLFLRGSSASAYINNPKVVLPYSFPFVGNAALAMAAHMSGDIILCGFDMGYKKGRKKHVKGTFYEGKDFDEDIPEDATLTKGNLSDDIYTDSLFTLGKSVATKLLSDKIVLTEKSKVYNMSDGAYIRGATPIKDAKELKGKIKLAELNKKVVFNYLRNMFSDKTSEVFRENDDSKYLKLIGEVQKELMDILDIEIKTKQELFNVIDKATRYINRLYEKDMVIDIMLRGTISHSLLAIVIVAFHLRSNDVTDVYKNSINTLNDGLSRIKSKYMISVNMAKSI